MYQKGGIPALISRLQQWSPRPFSEAIIFLYATAAMLLNRPMISAALAVSWLFLPLAVVAATIMNRWATRPLSILGVSLFALFLAGHKTGEMFYWPMASLAYLPAAAALLFLFLTMIGSDEKRIETRVMQAVALVVLAASIEIGAMFVLAFVIGMIALNLAFRGERAATYWIIVPTLVAIEILILLYNGRVTKGMELMGDPAIAHHFMQALSHGIKAFAEATFSLDGSSTDPASLILGSTSKFLFFIGAFFTVRAHRDTLRLSVIMLSAFSLACFGTAFLTISAAMYQFGLLCCERHDTFRQCLILLGIASAASAAAARGGLLSGQHQRGYLLILVAVFVAISGSAKDLMSDYARYRDLEGARIQNWRSGKSDGPSMTFLVPIPGRVVGGLVEPGGTYHMSNNPPVIPQGIMYIFHKSSVTIQPSS
ncbi:TPA: hypothetical protein ACKE3D_002101 [Burkholderia dolosa]